MKEIIGALLLWVSGGRIVTATARREMNKRKERWEAKCERIQWDLNHEHLNKYGWYVNDQHELIVTR